MMIPTRSTWRLALYSALLRLNSAKRPLPDPAFGKPFATWPAKSRLRRPGRKLHARSVGARSAPIWITNRDAEQKHRLVSVPGIVLDLSFMELRAGPGLSFASASSRFSIIFRTARTAIRLPFSAAW